MEIIDTLKGLDFTEYEAKAYLALLKESPLTGYAVAKNSGVPRSKIYEVLESLTARGDILVSPDDTPLYRPLPAKELIAKRKAKAAARLEAAEEALERFDRTKHESGPIWNITGYEAIFQKVISCVETARRRVLLELWAEDFPELAEALQAAAARGVQVIIVSYGQIEAPFATVYPHDSAEEITAEYGGRWVVFSADDGEVVAGAVSPEAHCRAAWTSHPGLVMPITEVVIHDLYIAELLNAHRDTLEQTFGKDLKQLREKFMIDGDYRKHYIPTDQNK